MFVADTGLGKTNFAMAVAFAMASGQSFLHWNSYRPVRVLFIDGEMSKRLLRSRIRDAVKRCGQIPETLYFVSCDDVEDMPPLNIDEGQAYVNALIDKFGGVDFIFFDNVQSLLCGDMKEEEPWQQTLPWIRDLTRRNIGQLWIHHTGHNTSRSYGTKTREWQLDAVIVAEAIERADTDIAFSVQFTKARERTPENRQDFANIVIRLAQDRWTFETADAAGPVGKLSPVCREWHRALLNALIVSAVPGRTTRTAWFAEAVRVGIADALHPDDTHSMKERKRSKQRKYLGEMLSAKLIGVDGETVTYLQTG
jgi:hypothetical protein